MKIGVHATPFFGPGTRPPAEVIGRPIWDFIMVEERSSSKAAFLEKMNGSRLTPFMRTQN